MLKFFNIDRLASKSKDIDWIELMGFSAKIECN